MTTLYTAKNASDRLRIENLTPGDRVQQINDSSIWIFLHGQPDNPANWANTEDKLPAFKVTAANTTSNNVVVEQIELEPGLEVHLGWYRLGDTISWEAPNGPVKLEVVEVGPDDFVCRYGVWGGINTGVSGRVRLEQLPPKHTAIFEFMPAG